MIYTDLEALALAATQVDLTDSASVEALSALLRVYCEALNNPPPGVVGVGAITYAQERLVAAQLSEAPAGRPYCVEYRTPSGRVAVVHVTALDPDAAIDAAVTATGCDFAAVQSVEARGL